MFGAIDAGILLEIAKQNGAMFQIDFDFPPMFEMKEDYLTSCGTGYKTNGHGFISTTDHPAFAEFRNHLENQGYIKTERNCSNGDRVTKMFYLNGKCFDVGEQFPCGAAMKLHLKYKRNLDYFDDNG